ncbi:hypothetical protein Tco_0585776 [Tanacetum coccineum]
MIMVTSIGPNPWQHLMSQVLRELVQFGMMLLPSTLKDGECGIMTIQGMARLTSKQTKIITKASLRRHLKLKDADGISLLPNTEIFEQLALMGVPTPPHDSPLLGGHTPGSDEGSMTLNELTVLCTQLSTKVASLEQDLKQIEGNMVMHYQAHHEGEEVGTQRGRIAKIDQNPSISLVQDEGTLWIQEDAEIQGRTSTDTEILLDHLEKTYECGRLLVAGEKVEKEMKAIMKEDESIQKKAKKQLEQERLGHEEAIRLQEQINEEERQRIARDA